MRIIYITRHFNKSGYVILNRIISENIKIEAVVLHKSKDIWNNVFLRSFLLSWYKFKCYYYRCKPSKTTNSEYLLAKKYHIPIFLIKSVKSNYFYEFLQKKFPDLIVIGGGWHELIPKRVFNLPKYGCINTHPSLLPEFRGTSITRWQIFYGVKRSGCTIHYVNDKFDAGGIVAQDEISVPNDITPQELFYKLSELGADLMVDLLNKFDNGNVPDTITPEHNKDFYKYFSKWKWSIEKLRIDWSKSFEEIHCKILANTQESYEYPGPYFYYNGKRFIIRITRLHSYNNYTIKGIYNNNRIYVVANTNDSLFIYRQGEKNVLEIAQIQKYDKFFKLRRAKKATKYLNLSPNNYFQPE